MDITSACRIGRWSLLVVAWLVVGHAGAACGADHAHGELGSAAPAAEPSGVSGGAADGGGGAAASPGARDAAVAEADGQASAAPPAPDLYDPATVPEIELTFDAAAMAVLSSTDPAQKETWVHGSFKMGAITFADVGVRRKGSYTFRALPQKASLKVKLNKWVKGQKVFGLTDLTLNNMVASPTFLAERLSFHVFRSLGLPAPKANTAHVTINGEDYGIYANVENPDKHFLSRAFGSKANTLYEVDHDSEWLPGTEWRFEIDVADPKAPEGTRPDLSALFAAVVAAKDESLIQDVAGHLDTKQWLRHSAAEAVTGHYDGYAYGIYASHNYFLAGDTDGKFSLVPWSADATLSDVRVFDAATPLRNTLLARCKLVPMCWSAYTAEVKAVVQVYETLDLVSLAKAWHLQVDPLVKADPKREIPLTTYDERTDRLYEWLKARPAIIRAQMGI